MPRGTQTYTLITNMTFIYGSRFKNKFECNQLANFRLDTLDTLTHRMTGWSGVDQDATLDEAAAAYTGNFQTAFTTALTTYTNMQTQDVAQAFAESNLTLVSELVTLAALKRIARTTDLTSFLD